MGTPYLSEMRIFSFNFAPKSWAMCNGQTLAINTNQALFALLGTTYGGNGQTTFNLPDLRGRVPIHFNSNFILGQNGGETTHTLLVNEIPQHTHTLVASSNSPNTNTPNNNFLSSNTGHSSYSSSQNELMAANALNNFGGSQPHNNMSPCLVLNICIALTGIFPSRN